MKIESMTDFINGQIRILQDLAELKKYYKDTKTPFEQERVELYIFSTLLLCGVKGKIQGENVILFVDGEQPLRIEKVRLEQNPFVKDIVKALPTDIEVQSKKLSMDRNPSENKEGRVNIPICTDSGSQNKKVPAHTESTDRKEEKIIAQTEMPKPNVLRLKDLPRENADCLFAEGTKYKYLKTMWMQQYEITYSHEDSYCEETFLFTVYPTAMNIERMSLPMLCVIQHENAKKFAFSSEVKSSIEIPMDDFQFGISLCFKEGKLSTIITQFNSQYKKVSEKILSDQQGELVPLCFGKRMIHGNEWIEIYPVGVDNDQQTGLAPFVYRAQVGKEVESGFSDYKNEAIVAFSGEAHSYGAYWTSDDAGERQLIVEEV